MPSFWKMLATTSSCDPEAFHSAQPQGSFHGMAKSPTSSWWKLHHQCGRETWQQIQKSRDANGALSPSHFHHFDGKKSLPLKMTETYLKDPEGLQIIISLSTWCEWNESINHGICCLVFERGWWAAGPMDATWIFAESVWQNYTEYTSNMFQWIYTFHWVFQALHEVVSSSFVQNVLAGGMFFGQSLVRVFYPCLSLNLERFEARGAPCAKSQTRTSWSWSHLFDGWDPGILKHTDFALLHVILFLCIICQCASWILVKFEDIAKKSGFRCSRLWHGGRVPPLQRRWVSGLQLQQLLPQCLCNVYVKLYQIFLG